MVQKDGDNWCVHKENADGSAGAKVKCHPSEAEAKDHMKALYANTDHMSLAGKIQKLFRFLGLDLETKEGERWVTINGQRVLVDEESGEVKGGNKKAVGWKDPHDEFKFVQRRLAAGNLKRGEKRMLERRSERLAKQVLGVKD
jgi:hypothetical protein